MQQTIKQDGIVGIDADDQKNSSSDDNIDQQQNDRPVQNQTKNRQKLKNNAIKQQLLNSKSTTSQLSKIKITAQNNSTMPLKQSKCKCKWSKWLNNNNYSSVRNVFKK